MLSLLSLEGLLKIVLGSGTSIGLASPLHLEKMKHFKDHFC
jgi:hypothetical protein